jgi:hypothetical protein
MQHVHAKISACDATRARICSLMQASNDIVHIYALSLDCIISPLETHDRSTIIFVMCESCRGRRDSGTHITFLRPCIHLHASAWPCITWLGSVNNPRRVTACCQPIWVRRSFTSDATGSACCQNLADISHSLASQSPCSPFEHRRKKQAFRPERILSSVSKVSCQLVQSYVLVTTCEFAMASRTSCVLGVSTSSSYFSSP